jgi:hypothetical protein
MRAAAAAITMIQVRVLAAADQASYSACVRRDPGAWIYGSTEYRDLLAGVAGGEPRYLVAVDEHEHVLGGFPVFEAAAPGIGTVINSLPWYGSHGGCVLSGDRADEVRAALIAAYRDRVSVVDPLSATVILTPAEQAFAGVYRTILQPAVEDERIGQVTPLPADGDGLDDRLQAVCSRKTRNLVRKSLKQGFALDRSDGDEAWEFLHATHQANLAAIGGRAKPWSQFVALRERLPEPMRKVSVATLDGEPVAALLLLFFGRTVEYFTPVVVESFRSRQPLSFLIYSAMIDAVRNGFTHWNWGGTWKTQASLYHFKAGWGAADLPYRYFVCSSDRGARVRRHRAELASAFPYYYVYPYDQLG